MRWMAGLVGSVVLATAGGAQAATVVATYTGQITSGVDTSGLFGPAGANLTGDAFDIVFNFDITGASQNDSGFSGNGVNDPSPLQSLALTINGQTYTNTSFGHGSSIVDYLFNLLGVDTVASSASGQDGVTSFTVAIQGPADAANHIFHGEFSGTEPANVQSFAQFNFGGGNVVYGIPTTFDVIGLPFVFGVPTPEPATWLLLATGVGLAGWRLRTAPRRS